ncbi:hypothetical protein INS49_015348 [Diaporthe citri]|uniref:uncharacterized protein n=1 Tax=Diaporthe citri TaxID=83186 RepID=UPI001C7E5E19|nr:uncharacterized protein INS49_015348 [Diaporthe citri]KAG6355963.1 hypothetical protein INS49_015348 [Diaporthe citri]
MEFATLQFSSAWLRRTFTNEHDPPVQVRLAAYEHNARERKLAEVRYGNNITLLLKACYFLRDFHGSAMFWLAISRVFGVGHDVTKSVVDVFVVARAIYRSNFPTAHDTAPLLTETTQWADKWTSFLSEQKQPTPASDSGVFAAVDDFFRKEKGRNGDLASVLSKGPAMDPPSAPRALRKRSPSPSTSQGTPNAKRRAVSRSTDEPGYDSPPGRTRSQCLAVGSQPSSHHKPEPHETTLSTNGRQYQNDQVLRTGQEEPYFELKIRGQAQKDNRNSPGHQDHHWSEADEYEALAQSNIELQDRVDSFEKERLEAARAQKDRDDAIRSLQARFATFEKISAAADAQSSVNDKLIREMQEMVKRFGTQAERLKQLEKQLELSDQAAQRMQATISSLQKNGAIQARPANDQAGVATAETKTADEGAPAALKEEVSEMHIRIKSLEAKSIFFNDLHKNVREMKADIAAQKVKTAASVTDCAKGQNEQVTSTRLRAIEEAMERQGQAVHGMTDRVVALEVQATVRNARISSLEDRLDKADDISQFELRVSTVEQKQINDLKMLDCRLTAMQGRSAEIQDKVEELSKGLGDVGSLPFIKAISDGVAEMQTRIANTEEHGTEVSKRLDDMEVSQDALTLHDQSSRIDEVSQSLESLKSLLLGLARSDDVEALRAEFNSLSQQQAVASQSMGRGEDALASVTGMIDSLSNRMTRLDDMYEMFATERRNRPDQLFHTNGNTVQDGKQNDVSAVIDSLCHRVSVMENGFQIMRDALSGRRR